jgi:N,N'-diacetylchitobiose transport system permease protein
VTTPIVVEAPAAEAFTAAPPRAGRRRRPVARVALNVAGLLVFLVSVFPVYWMVTTSFRRGVDVQSPDPQFLPFPGGTLENYRKVFSRDFFWSALRNSLMITLLTVALALMIAFLAAVAVSRFRFRGRKAFIVAILLVQMVPAEALIIALFKVLDGWRLINTVIGLTLTYLVFVLPFTIWMLRGFVANVPKELEEAAMVDGSSRLRAFLTVTFPLIAPGLVATGVFAFIQAWNEFIFALVIMNRPEHQTLPVWLQAFNEGAKGTDWGGVMAGSTLMAIPVIAFFLVVQHRVTAGLTAGAVKG